MIPGRYVKSLAGHRCFIPDELPPTSLVLSKSVQRLVEDTTHALGKVDICRNLVPNPGLLNFASLNIEAMASSTIENTIASADELMLFQATQRADREEVREVANYGTALQLGVQILKERPLSVNLFLNVHEALLSGVRGHNHGGRIKTHQNYIAPKRTDPIEKATYVPPPPEATLELLGNLEKYINLDPAESKVVQVALAHYQFETIHPFADGNGRVGRLLIVLQLMQLGLISAPMIYPSVYFEETRSDYYALLQSTRQTADWNAWIAYFVLGLKTAAERTLQLVETVRRVQMDIHARPRDVRRKASVDHVIDVFLEFPIRSIQDLADGARISFGTAQRAAEELEQEGLLTAVKGKRNKRVYQCQPIIDAIFGRDGL